MLGVKVEIRRYVNDAQPGVVECLLVDAWGKQHLFIEKVPVVTAKNLDASSSYPRAGVIACRIVERRDVYGREIVKVETETPWGVESTDGETRFDVSGSQLVEAS